MKNNILKFILISSLSTSLYAAGGYSSGSTNSGTTSSTGTTTSTDAHSTGTTTPTAGPSATSRDMGTSTDTISTGQSSTMSSNCISVSRQGKLCDEKATTWCGNHKGSSECKSFRSDSSTTDTMNSDSTQSTSSH